MVFALFLFFSLTGSVLFLSGKRTFSMFIFFFFVTLGFQLIPLEVLETAEIKDFAILQGTIIFFGLLLKERSEILAKKSRVDLWLLCFWLTLFVIWIVNLTILKIPLFSTITTGRIFLFLTAFYFFRKLTEQEIRSIKQILLFVTIIQCFLFICQIVLGEQILNGFYGGGKVSFAGFKIPRGYNIPYLLPYFLFQVFFTDLAKGRFKIFLQALFFLTLVLPMHRSWIASLFVVLIYGMFIKINSKEKLLKYTFIFLIVFLPVAGFFMKNLLMSSRTMDDIDIVLSLSSEAIDIYEDFDVETDSENTLFYRFSHLFERIYYISQTKTTLLFGGGWMDENSNLAKKLDFMLITSNRETNEEYMINTPDIAWSMLFFRLGLIGIATYMAFYITLIIFFFKRKHKQGPAIGVHLFLIFTLFTSFTSVELYTLWPLLLPALDYVLCLKKETEKYNFLTL